jgi:hypothetical protein
MNKRSIQISLVGMASMLAVITAQPVGAQTPNANVYSAPSGDRNSGSFNSNSSGDLGGMFDLFHRAVLGVPRSGSEFRQEQRQQIGSEASDFRQRQQELLRQQSGGGATTPQNVPPSTPPAQIRLQGN